MASLSASKTLDEIPACSICLQSFSYPIRLQCGHVFDFDCLSAWARKNNTCPIDRIPINAQKTSYDSDIIKDVSATFRLSVSDVDLIILNIYSNVQKLKQLYANAFMTQVADPVVAIFSPRKREISPRNYCFSLAHQVVDGVEMQVKRLYSDTPLSSYQIKAGKTYQIVVQYKLAQFGIPCDHCYGNPEKEKTCSHPDENEVDEKSNS